MMKTDHSKHDVIINRGWSSAGAYFYSELPDGRRLESAYEGALLEMIDDYYKQQLSNKE